MRVNGAGNILSTQTKAANGSTALAKYEYDLLNRLTKVISPNNEVTQYSYLPTGQLEQITDPLSKVTSFEYDQLGQVTKKTDPNNEIYTFGYDANGNRVQEKDPNGNLKVLTYNELDQLTQVQYPDDVIQMSYDDKGEISSIENTISQISYQYDSKKRPIQIAFQGKGSFNLNYSLGMNYDRIGNRTKLMTPYGNVASVFDHGNRLTSLISDFGGSFSYTYDQAGRTTSMERPGSTTTFTYTAASLIASIYHKSGSVVKSFVEYSYNPKNYISQRRSPAGSTDYSYDMNGQLTGSVGSSQGPESFVYDGLGNRIQSGADSLTYDNTKQRLVSDSNYTYGYDHNGNVLFKNPIQINQKAYQFGYNSKNQLTSVSILDGAMGPVLKLIQYKYDALGRRIEKSVTDQVDSAKSYTRRYMLDQDDVLAELDENNSALAIYTHANRTPDDVLSVQVTSAGAAKGLAAQAGNYYYLKDHLGSVTDIQDGSGNILQKYEYSSFGKIVGIKDGSGNDITANPVVNTAFTYTGREYEPEYGMYYYRARYYDPSTGRFLQQDPDPGTLSASLTVVNKYIYTVNSPLMYTDPTGKFVFALPALLTGIFEAVGSAAIGSFVSAVVMTVFQGGNWGNFVQNFQSIFAVSVIFLAVGAVWASLPTSTPLIGGGGGIKSIGASSIFQGNIISRSGGGLTIGHAAVMGSSVSPMHELGHSIQFMISSGLAGAAARGTDMNPAALAFGAYLTWGGWGLRQQLLDKSSLAETSATDLGAWMNGIGL